MWIDWHRKYQPAETEYEVCWRVSEAKESQTSNSVEQADIFQYQSYSHSDDMFVILKLRNNSCRPYIGLNSIFSTLPQSEYTSRAVSTPRVKYIRACVYVCLLSIWCFNIVLKVINCIISYIIYLIIPYIIYLAISCIIYVYVIWMWID
jgi:hypothetical protein